MYGNMTDGLNINYPDPEFWTKTSLIQLIYGILVNLTLIATGQAFGFSSIMIPQLPIVEPKIITTISDESWIVSVLPLANLFGNLISGFLTDRYGRRIGLILCSIPMAIGWIYTGFARSAKDLIIGRIIVGLGCGMGMAPPRVYLTEISLPNMRGVIGCFPNVAISLGVTAQAALASSMTWYNLAFCNGAFCVTLFFISFMFPETPYYVLMKESPEKTKDCLKKFRSSKYDIEVEMDQLLDYKADNDIHKINSKKRLKILFSKSACKPYCIAVVYVIFGQLSGISLVMMWAIEMLQASKSSVDANTGYIMLGLTRLLAGIGTSILILKMGRRPLALTSSVGVWVVFLILGLHILYASEPSVLPEICYIALTAFASLGYYSLPLLIMFELTPFQIRGMLGSVAIATLNILIFAVNKYYLYVEEAIGFAKVILGFSTFSLLASIYIYVFLPETKDLTLQEIEEFYNEKRPVLTSQRRILSMQALSRHGMASKSLMRIET